MIIVISLYVCILLVVIGVMIFSDDKKIETTELKADIVFYLRGESEEIDRKLSLFFSQSLWYDLSYIDKIYLVKYEKQGEITDICLKYARKYKNIVICND